MAASVEDGLEEADRRGRGPGGTGPTLGSFLALEIAVVLSFPNGSGSDLKQLQSSILYEISKEVQGKNRDSVSAKGVQGNRQSWNLSPMCL